MQALLPWVNIRENLHKGKKRKIKEGKIDFVIKKKKVHVVLLGREEKN